MEEDIDARCGDHLLQEVGAELQIVGAAVGAWIVVFDEAVLAEGSDEAGEGGVDALAVAAEAGAPAVPWPPRTLEGSTMATVESSVLAARAAKAPAMPPPRTRVSMGLAMGMGYYYTHSVRRAGHLRRLSQPGG